MCDQLGRVKRKGVVIAAAKCMMQDRLMARAVKSPSHDPAAGRMSLTDIAQDAVTEAIFNRRIEPGARLRIEALATELAMSSTPVREALARTTAAGLTRLDANRGYTVAPLLDGDSFHLLFAARHTIEAGAVRGNQPQPAAWVRNVANADVRKLRSVVTKMARVEHGANYAGYSRFSRLDHSLHLALIELAGNPFLVNAWQGLHFHLHMSRLYAGAGVVDYDDAHTEHTAIVDALEQRDGAALWRACDAHMTRAEKRLVSLLP